MHEGLISPTAEVNVTKVTNRHTGRSVLLFDTPGVGYAYDSMDILLGISNWLISRRDILFILLNLRF